MGTIFISYRRSDSLAVCRSMAAELQSYFGRESVFFDETTARPGAQWPARIRAALSEAAVVLVVIGPRWLHARADGSGRRRINTKKDWVREEIGTALRRQAAGDDVEILPILVGDTEMPKPHELSKELAALSHLQPLRLPSTDTPEPFAALESQLVRWRFIPIVRPLVRTPVMGKVPPPLSEDEERAFVGDLKEWNILETRDVGVSGSFRRELHRVYEFESFDSAFQFMNEVVARGIRPQNHHPRWQNVFNRVEVWLSTFNVDYKPTKRDVRLARLCEQVWREMRPREARAAVPDTRPEAPS